MNEANRKHSSSRWIAFDNTFHPVFVISSLVKNNENFSFFKFKLVVIVRITVIKSATSFQSSLRERNSSLITLSRLQCNEAYVVDWLNCNTRAASRRSVFRHKAAVWVNIVRNVKSTAWWVQVTKLSIIAISRRVGDGIIKWLKIKIVKLWTQETSENILPFWLAWHLVLLKRFDRSVNSNFHLIVHSKSICLQKTKSLNLKPSRDQLLSCYIPFGACGGGILGRFAFTGFSCGISPAGGNTSFAPATNIIH
jgi:hypothetical protein